MRNRGGPVTHSLRGGAARRRLRSRVPQGAHSRRERPNRRRSAGGLRSHARLLCEQRISQSACMGAKRAGLGGDGCSVHKLTVQACLGREFSPVVVPPEERPSDAGMLVNGTLSSHRIKPAVGILDSTQIFILNIPREPVSYSERSIVVKERAPSLRRLGLIIAAGPRPRLQTRAREHVKDGKSGMLCSATDRVCAPRLRHLPTGRRPRSRWPQFALLQNRYSGTQEPGEWRPAADIEPEARGLPLKAAQRAPSCSKEQRQAGVPHTGFMQSSSNLLC